MPEPPMPEPPMPTPAMNRHRPAALQNPAAIYVAGLFSMGYADFYIFLMPLYGLSLGMSAGEIGMLVGARSLLAVFLSIHVGVVDGPVRHAPGHAVLRLDRRSALAPVFPLVPWFWPLLLLQIVNGGALSFAWSGSQTLIAQLAEGEAGYIGRFSFFARIGTAVAPIVAGAGLGFRRRLAGLSARRGLGRRADRSRCCARPEAEIAPRDGRQARAAAFPAARRAAAPVGLRRVLRADGDPGGRRDDGDHASCATPPTACSISLYVVYLDGIGLIGTAIGILFAAIEIASGFGSLVAGRAMRLRRPAADDAERHRAVDPVDLRDAVSRRHLRCCCCWRSSGAAGCKGWCSR